MGPGGLLRDWLIAPIHAVPPSQAQPAKDARITQSGSHESQNTQTRNARVSYPPICMGFGSLKLKNLIEL